MDVAKIVPILPKKLQRRINRLIKIDDILIDESTSPELQNGLSDENVCCFLCIIES